MIDVKTDEVMAMIDWRVHAFGLEGWRITVQFRKLKKGGAKTVAMGEYEEAQIVFDLSTIEDLDQLRYIIDHELIHLLLASYSNFGIVAAGDDKSLVSVLDHHEELVCSRLSRCPAIVSTWGAYGQD